MTKDYCIIDCGSNSLRYLIQHGTHQTEGSMWLGLGEDISQTGSISAHKFDQLQKQLESICLDARDKGVNPPYILLTTASFRDAQNQQECITALSDLPLKTYILSGDEEAELTHYAVQHLISDQKSPYWVFDLGGGSLEVNYVTPDKIHAASWPLGIQRLRHDPSLINYMHEQCQAFCEQHNITCQAPGLWIGGSAQAIMHWAGHSASQTLEWSRQTQRHYAIRLLQLDATACQEWEKDLGQRAHHFPLLGSWISTLTGSLPLNNLTLCKVSLIDGYIHKYLDSA